MLEGKRISELETVTNLQQGCCFPVLSSGATKRITFGSLLSEIENKLPQTDIEEIKEDVAELKVKSEKIDTLDADVTTIKDDVANVKEEVAGVDEMVQGQNTAIRNCVSTVEDLEQVIETTHFDDVLELENQVHANTTGVNNINAKIPAQATAENQLADKDFVNSTVGTNTAHYISDNGEPFTSLADLQAYEGIVTQNDYAFITGTDESGNTYFDRYKADVNGDVVTWGKEYRLNNSSFTAAQWAAINSGITQALINSLATKTYVDNAVSPKADKSYADNTFQRKDKHYKEFTTLDEMQTVEGTNYRYIGETLTVELPADCSYYSNIICVCVNPNDKWRNQFILYSADGSVFVKRGNNDNWQKLITQNSNVFLKAETVLVNQNKQYTFVMPTFFSATLAGFAQGIGPVFLLIGKYGDGIAVKDLFNFNDFNNPYLTITANGNEITISAPQTSSDSTLYLTKYW